MLISYVTKGVQFVRAGVHCLNNAIPPTADRSLRKFCSGYHRVYTDHVKPALTGLPNGLWAGERVGTAYDATMLLVAAVRKLTAVMPRDTSRTFDRAGLVEEITRGSHPGVTGTVDYTRSHVAVSKPMTILTIPDLGVETSVPACEFTLGQPYTVLGGTEPCPFT
jgi:hypothetical protein